jgi:hypothetical protein
MSGDLCIHNNDPIFFSAMCGVRSFFIRIDHQRAHTVFAWACSTLLFNFLPLPLSRFFFRSYTLPDLEYVSKPMVNYFFFLSLSLSLSPLSSLSLTSPFILIIDGGQQSFALAITQARAVRTTLRNRSFVFEKKQQATSLILFLTAAGDYSTSNAIRRDGEYIID